MRVLYVGDSPVGGPANYLLGVLRFLDAQTMHLPPAKPLRDTSFEKHYDVVIFSDYPARRCSLTVQKAIARAVERGMGFAMIGGWGSFSGPLGGWKGSIVEKLLPVKCLGRDDRINFSGGAAILLKQKHKILKNFPSHNLPVICGLNHVIPRREAKVVLVVRKIVQGRAIGLEKREYPLLIASSDTTIRTAALATDVAPHWCGGMVDWGTKTLNLSVAGKIRIEVGDAYVRFWSSILRWLSREPR